MNDGYELAVQYWNERGPCAAQCVAECDGACAAQLKPTLAERLSEPYPRPVPFYMLTRMDGAWKFKFGPITFIWCEVKHTYKWMLFWG